MYLRLIVMDNLATHSERPVNWELCVICQLQTNETLQRPANSKRNDVGQDTNL